MTDSSLRRFPLDRTWSLVAPGRSGRPQRVDDSASKAICPFCEGNELETEPEVFALRHPDSLANTPGWTVRVVPNRFPALSVDAPRVLPTDALDHVVAYGFHEVVIETAKHDQHLARSTVQHLKTILTVYQCRLRTLSREAGIASLVVIRNEGRAAGSSQEHPHSQIFALPLVPGRLQQEVAAAQRHFYERGHCAMCEMIEHNRQRIITENQDFVALTSFAPRFSYETWIIPTTHAHDFRELGQEKIQTLAQILKEVFSALESTHASCPYNLVLQTAPVDSSNDVARSFHWRLELLPRLSTPSGLELGCDVFIVPVSPEQAAAELRQVLQ
jgi:UDPglucose--hexose-1-phosphate uridylyltransferase